METALEYILMNSRKAQMISYLSETPGAFEEAVNLMLQNKQPYSWRAAWLLWSCMEPNDKRLTGQIPQMIKALPECTGNMQREFLKILQNMETPEEQQGILFDHCIRIWEQVGKQSSVRFNAFRTIVKIAGKHPELTQEIKLLVQEHYLEDLSDAAKRSVMKLFKSL